MDPRYKLIERYSVDLGRYLVETEDGARMMRNVFCKEAKIHKVLAVQTPMGIVHTSPLVLIEEIKE
jgi:hypothetical protein